MNRLVQRLAKYTAPQEARAAGVYPYFRAIESRAQEQIHRGTYHSRLSSGYLYSNYIIVLCVFLVLAAIIVYLHRLKR